MAWRGRVILAEGYGKADHAFDQPNRPDTKFFIGSITKQFTAAAIGGTGCVVRMGRAEVEGIKIR